MPAEQVLDGIELQLQPDALAALQSFYTEAAADLAQVSSRGPDLPAYHSLEWRLQVQVAGRHVVAGDLQPSYLLRLHTEDPRGFGAPRAEHLLQACLALAPPSTPSCPARPRSVFALARPRSPPLAPARPPSTEQRASPLAAAGGLCQPAPPRDRAGRRAARGDLDTFTPHRAPPSDPPRRVIVWARAL
jgi:hypothetical protein